MARRMRILVTGAGGCVGRAIRARSVGVGADVRCVTHAELDVTDRTAAERLVAAWSPDAVLFCAAVTDVDRCAVDPGAYAVNVTAPIAWARLAPTWLLSTNYVFDGTGPHAPGAPRTPRGAYARHKCDAEDGVLAAGGHVARVGWIVGAGGRTFPSQLAARLRRDETVRAIADRLVQPSWSLDLADALLALPPGVTHQIGAAETTWFDFATAVRARVGRGSVVPVPVAALDLPEPRPTDARLTPALLPPWTAHLDAISALSG